MVNPCTEIITPHDSSHHHMKRFVCSMQEMAHFRDIIEARGMIDVTCKKLLDFCNKHIQFYILSKYLYDINFFLIHKTLGQKLDLMTYSSLPAGDKDERGENLYQLDLYR